MSSVILAAAGGLLTGLGLIVVIGAQNAFVLRTGLAEPPRAVALVVAICLASDIALMTAGVLGVGSALRAAPVLLVVLRIVGAAFLLAYGLLAARRALRPHALAVADRDRGRVPRGAGVSTAVRPALRSVAVTALAFTWLNPNVYLDTLVLLGTLATQQPEDLRWWWIGGAMAGSAAWFSALGFGARALRPLLQRPGVWRAIDVGIAVVMVVTGLRLAISG